MRRNFVGRRTRISVLLITLIFVLGQAHSAFAQQDQGAVTGPPVGLLQKAVDRQRPSQDRSRKIPAHGPRGVRPGQYRKVPSQSRPGERWDPCPLALTMKEASAARSKRG